MISGMMLPRREFSAKAAYRGTKGIVMDVLVLTEGGFGPHVGSTPSHSISHRTVIKDNIFKTGSIQVPVNLLLINVPKNSVAKHIL